MDSVMEDDPSLPLDFEKSSNLAKFKEAMAAGAFGGEMLEYSAAELAEGGAVSLASGSQEAVSGQDDAVSPQTNTMKDYEFQMSELKKENFGLKLRIYFLEERMSHDDTPEDTFKANIELKVTVEKLKKGLVEKQELLVKASNAVEMIANHSEAQINQIRQEHNEELQEIREGYENKVKEIEKELTVANHDVEELAERLTEAVYMNQQLNEKLLESTDGFHDDQRQLQEDTKETLNVKDKMIDDLNDALEIQKQATKELEYKADTLEQEKLKAHNDLRKIVEGEKKLKQMTDELTKRNKGFEDVKEKARKLEKLNRDLRNQLHEKERELHLNSRNVMDTSSKSKSPNSKEDEMRTKTKIDDLEQSLAAARESAHTAKMKWYQTFEEHAEVVKAKNANIAVLQSTNSAKELEVERFTQAMASKDVELQRLNNGKLLLEQRLDEALKDKNIELAELATKLKALSHEYSDKVDSLEEHCRKVVAGAQEQVCNKDKVIANLAADNSEKDRIIEDFVEALKEASADSSTAEGTTDVRDALLKKLQVHLREKDRAVETAINEKFRSLEEKDMELQQFRQALRDRDRLIEKINSAVVGAEEQIKLLENACNEKDDIAHRLKTTCLDQEKAHQAALTSVAASLHEKEAVFQKLKNTLESRENELAELKEFVKDLTRSSFQSRTEDSIKTRDHEDELKAKEKLLQDLLFERSRMSSAHEANTQRLMAALQDKDNLLKDATEQLARVQNEKMSTIQRLQQLLNGRDHEIQSLENSKAWAYQEQDLLVGKLRSTLTDKDRSIEDLVQSSKEKDQMLLKLQDSLRSPKKAQNTTEVDKMRQTIKELEAGLSKKSESLRKLEADYQANMRNSQAEVENIENKMKIENLQHELETKVAILKQAQETIGNLRTKQQNMPTIEAYLAAQKAKEQARMELASLKKSRLEYEAELKAKHDNIDILTQAAQIKDNVIKEMQDTQNRQLQEMQENVGYYQKKAYDHETSNDALRNQLAQSTDLNNSLQGQLEQLRHALNSKSPTRHDVQELNQLRDEVAALRAQLLRPGTPQRENTGVGAGLDEQENGVEHLQRALDGQVKETTRLNDILRKEREMYINVVQHLRDSPSDPNKRHQSEASYPSVSLKEKHLQSMAEDKLRNFCASVTRELQTLKALRTQLEEGIRQNNVLRLQLQNQMLQHSQRTPSPQPPPPYDAVYQREIQGLKSKLEDSERWNASLQARLNELQPRAGGVGGSSGVDSIDRSVDDGVSAESIRQTEQQVVRLTNQLQQSSQLNVRLSKELDEIRKSSSQIANEKDSVMQSQTHQVTSLQKQLRNMKQTFGELENRLRDANAKLEYYARSVNVDFEELLLERQQEVDSLRTQLQELQLREHASSPGYRDTIGSDVAAQTSPGRDWGYVSSERLRQVEEKLRQELAESRHWNEQYKKLLDEKVTELQMSKKKEAIARRAESPEKTKEMTEIHRLRQEYEKGIRTNEDLKHQMESELDCISERENSLQHDVLTVSDLRQKLDESLRLNDSLQGKLREIVNSNQDANSIKKELSTANKVNESLAMQIQDLHQSIQRFSTVGDEAERLRNGLKEARQLNKTLSEQLKDTRKSTEEMAQLQRELRQAKMMNEQLGKQLAELLSHMAKFKSQNEKLKNELDQKKRTIDSLEFRLSSRPDVQSRGVSPFTPLSVMTSTSPQFDFATTQTSPSMRPGSPHSTSSLGSPRPGLQGESPGVIEKMHKLNRTLMAENQFLRNKLKQYERYNTTLKEELDLYSRIKKETFQIQTSPTRLEPSTDELLASYMTEMRELRLRLEESIRTNDALRAQLEKRITEQGTGEDHVAVFSSDKVLFYVRENDTLRAELLEKDKANEILKRAMEDLKKDNDKASDHLQVLRQQVEESHKAMENLRHELSVYERLYKMSSGGRGANIHANETSYVREGPRSPDGETDNSSMALLLAEIRSLRVQLEKSIQTNNALRLKLEEQLNRPLRYSPQSSRTSPSAVARRLDFRRTEGEERAGSPTGHLSAHVDREYFIELEAKIECICNETQKVYGNIQKGSQLLVEASVRNVQTWANDCKHLLKKFFIEDNIGGARENSTVTTENITLRLEIAKLKKKLLSQEDVIKRACERLEETNRMKDSIQTKIIDQLSESQAVLQKARGSLEVRHHSPPTRTTDRSRARQDR